MQSWLWLLKMEGCPIEIRHCYAGAHRECMDHLRAWGISMPIGNWYTLQERIQHLRKGGS